MFLVSRVGLFGNATLIDAQLQKFREVIAKDLPELNQMVKDKGIDAVQLKQEKKSS